MTRLEKAREKRAKKAARKGASAYAKQDATDAAELKRCAYWQAIVERRAVTEELEAEKLAKLEALEGQPK